FPYTTLFRSYEFQSVDITNLENKVKTIDVSLMELNDFHREKEIELQDTDLNLNASVILRAEENHKQSGLARYKEYNGKRSLGKINVPSNVFGIKSRNVGQSFALDLLL